MPSAKFNEVYAKAGKIANGPSNDELLDLYAWAKIAEGKKIEESYPDGRPGVFNMKNRAKYDRWQKCIDEDLPAEEAEKKYIELGEQLIAKHS